jgi:hypothetical protein
MARTVKNPKLDRGSKYPETVDPVLGVGEVARHVFAKHEVMLRTANRRSRVG